MCERGSDVAFVDLGIDDVASLAGILGIEKLFPLLHLCERIAVGRHGIAVECRSLIRGHDVVGQFLRVVIGNVESRHAADQRRTQRAGVLQERLQPLTLHRTAFPGEVGSQVAATAIDGVASEASHVRHEPSSLARGLVIRRRFRGHGQGERQIMCPVGEREQCRRQRIDLRGGKGELRHLQRRSKGMWLPDLGCDVVRYSVRHPGQKNNLGERLTPDAGQFRSEVIRLLDAVDQVT